MRKVVYTRLKKDLFVDSLGFVGQTFPSKHAAGFKPTMYLGVEGLYMEFSPQVKVVVPHDNIEVTQLNSEESVG